MKMEGYLRKNRAGMPFAKMSNRRYFTTEGFTVFYYADSNKGKVKGHFDLRNVTGIMASKDPGVGEGAVDLIIWDANGPQKHMVVSFSPDADQRDAWLKLWCSAISPQYLADLVTWGAIGARTTESQVGLMCRHTHTHTHTRTHTHTPRVYAHTNARTHRFTAS